MSDDFDYDDLPVITPKVIGRYRMVPIDQYERDRAVLDAAEVIERDHQRTVMVLGGARLPCQCSICVAVRARREAQ